MIVTPFFSAMSFIPVHNILGNKDEVSIKWLLKHNNIGLTANPVEMLQPYLSRGWRGGGLITKSDCQRGGGLIREGGLIELLRY